MNVWTLLASCTLLVLVSADSKEPPSECDAKWSKNPETGTCFKVQQKHRMNFTDAQEFCQTQFQAELTQNVTSFTQRKFAKGLVRYRSEFWIGVTDQDGDGTFTYLDGSNLERVPPFKKKKGQPGVQNTHRCVVFQNWRQRKWVSRHCGEKRLFICEKEL